MKKYIFLALLTMGVSSCQLVDVLDQKPEFEADLDGAINNTRCCRVSLKRNLLLLARKWIQCHISYSKWFLQSRDHVASRNCQRR